MQLLDLSGYFQVTALLYQLSVTYLRSYYFKHPPGLNEKLKIGVEILSNILKVAIDLVLLQLYAFLSCNQSGVKV